MRLRQAGHIFEPAICPHPRQLLCLWQIDAIIEPCAHLLGADPGAVGVGEILGHCDLMQHAVVIALEEGRDLVPLFAIDRGEHTAIMLTFLAR